MNQATEKTVLSVGYRYEADSAAAALSDAGIASYIRQTPSDNLFVLPSALGFTENGFDVVVRMEDAEKAEELLASLGMGTDEDVVAAPEDAVIDVAAEELTDKSTDEEITEEANAEEQPEPTLLQKIGVAVLALIAVALVVWLTDSAVFWVQRLLGCGRYA
ncbi:MAG: hypothetical protein E7559_09915 [Ruminococcaceae bacterium]|nr:hypothetical protein [Oscillospiraceae bacterium]